MTRIVLVIPTYNAENHLQLLLPAITAQTLKPTSTIVIDSSSSDRTAFFFREFGATVHVIPQSQFDHGGTRSLGVDLARPADIVIFLTQDAIPAAPDAFARLIEAFEDPRVGMVYGRQLPHEGANPLAVHARLFNYPAKSEVIGKYDRAGIRATFASDSFSAYRVVALDAVGGFPAPILFGEDMVVACRMLEAGWRKVYAADSKVYHSHNYTLLEEFRRYFDVGVVHAQQSLLLSRFGGVAGEGKKFFRSEIDYLRRNAPGLIPSALTRTAMKLIGYRLGLLERYLPDRIKRSCSMSGWFWKGDLPA
jgi:rhamnosyltransferase